MCEAIYFRITAERTDNGVYVIASTDIIVFTHANPSDSGLYNCSATNKLGSAWRAYRVTVEEEGKLLHMCTNTHTHVRAYTYTHKHTGRHINSSIYTYYNNTKSYTSISP